MIKIHHTGEEAFGMLILIIVGYLVWVVISTFSKGPGSTYGYEDDGYDDGGGGLPDPPLFQQLIGCNPVAWFIVIIAMAGFLCWYPTTLK